MPHPFMTCNYNRAQERRQAFDTPPFSKGRSNPFMIFNRPNYNGTMPADYNGFNHYHVNGPRSRPPYFNMANVFWEFQNKNQNSAVDRSGCPYRGNVNIGGDINAQRNWMNVPPPMRTSAPPPSRAQMALFPISYAGVAQGLHRSSSNAMRFPNPNGFPRPQTPAQNANVRHVTNIDMNRSECNNYTAFGFGCRPQHIQTPPPAMFCNNSIPFPKNDILPRCNGYPPNMPTPPPNAKFDSTQFPFSLSGSTSSRDSLSASCQSQCQIEENRVEDQNIFQVRHSNSPVSNYMPIRQSQMCTHTNENYTQQKLTQYQQRNTVTPEQKWNFQNQDIEHQQELMKNWILGCTPEVISNHINLESSDEQGESSLAHTQKYSFSDEMVFDCENMEVNNHSKNGIDYTEEQQFTTDEQVSDNQESNDCHQGSDGLETNSDQNPEDLTSEHADICEPENDSNDIETGEAEEEPKKYSKSYWRKQRRLRLKERLLAEKLNLEADPDYKRSDEEKEAMKANKAVKSAGESWSWNC